MKDVLARYFGQRKVRFGNRLTLGFYRAAPFWLRALGVYSIRAVGGLLLPRTRFIIFAQGRTGSTLLVDLLNSHPDIFSYGEIFAKNVMCNVRWPVYYAEGLAVLGRRPACGFKVKVYQFSVIQTLDPGTALENFVKRGWRIIYLRRENLLYHAISDIMSDKTGVFHKLEGHEREKTSRVEIGYDELIRTIEFRQWCLETEEKALAGIDFFPISYEQDLQDATNRNGTLNRLMDFLGLPQQQFTTQFKKVTSTNLEDVVEGWTTLEKRLRQTDYARFL